MDILKEARRLYDLGWGVHWLLPRSKAPVKKGWGSGPRDPWEVVERDYRKGYGLGVRLGEASQLARGGFLANIDVDIKSGDPRHREEALAALEAAYPGLLERAPIVATSYGLRLFVRTAEPLKSVKLARSGEECIVSMPTAEISARQRQAVGQGLISEEQLGEGLRLRPAWELEFMSAGRQVVLPPSIHPETKTPYSWMRPLAKETLPLVTARAAEGLRNRQAQDSTAGTGKGIAEKFVAVKVDIEFSVLPDAIVKMITTGEGVGDRSAALFTVAKAMKKAKFSENEILSVLTDRDYHLGETAYHHRKTKDRAYAAAWVAEHTLQKAALEVSPAHAFRDEAAAADETHESPAAAAAAADELTAVDWTMRLERRRNKNGEEGPPLPTLENTVLVLENAIGAAAFKFDLFASREVYGLEAPWTNGTAGKKVDDRDNANMMLWFGQRFRFEPPDHILTKAVQAVADKNPFHPVVEELEALAPWDGTPRLGTWLRDHMEAKGNADYLAQVFTKWLVASVWRTYQPGKKFDWFPIFENATQGTGKSKIGVILFGERYFSDHLPPLEEKDAALQLEGLRCVEFSELVNMRRSEVETAKAFITRTTDKVRRPYGRRWDEIPRQCVFFGTTNQDTYLKDPSGNRRFMPVEVGRIDELQLERDRDQLWAEALAIYRAGQDGRSYLYLDGQAGEFALRQQKAKMVDDESIFMVDAFTTFYVKEAAKRDDSQRFDFNRFKLVNLFGDYGPFARWKPTAAHLQFAGRVMKEVGAEKVKIHGQSWWRLSVEAGHQLLDPSDPFSDADDDISDLIG